MVYLPRSDWFPDCIQQNVFGGLDMKTVQLAIQDSGYAQSLRSLLLRDGAHLVHVVDRPNLGLDGVVMMDENTFQNLEPLNSEPERFVVIASKGTEILSRVWDAGIRHVVFEDDPPHTAQLAIIAAELRLPKDGPVANLDRVARCRKCGPQNADTGF